MTEQHTPLTKPCPICGEMIKNTAQKCIKCEEFLIRAEHGWKQASLQELKRKSLWDYMRLLLVPLALALISIFFTFCQNNRQFKLETSRVQENALQDYLDDMSILIGAGLPDSSSDDIIRELARARTLTVLGQLDPDRKGVVLQFLHEAELIQLPSLITDTVIVDLNRADLSGVNLSTTNLSKADLSGTNLGGANLSGVNLRGTIIENSTTQLDNKWRRVWGILNEPVRNKHLGGADLSAAYLQGADLSGADLGEADLSKANLSGADLSRTDLSAAKLSGANLTNARFDESTSWPPNFNPQTAGAIVTSS